VSEDRVLGGARLLRDKPSAFGRHCRAEQFHRHAQRCLEVDRLTLDRAPQGQQRPNTDTLVTLDVRGRKKTTRQKNGKAPGIAGV
jgi:hypothetical protein